MNPLKLLKNPLSTKNQIEDMLPISLTLLVKGENCFIYIYKESDDKDYITIQCNMDIMKVLGEQNNIIINKMGGIFGGLVTGQNLQIKLNHKTANDLYYTRIRTTEEEES
ncbi:MAG: hypothetical protein FWF27_00990 [Candidatus Bathyarchaeota archaeon]|nr:hypothetical protein [Candidatus Termiticorpusculum sp.]